MIDWEAGLGGAFAEFFRKKGRKAPDLQSLFARWEDIQFKLLRPYRPYREIVKMSIMALMRKHRLSISAREASAFTSRLAGSAPFPDVRAGLESLKNRYLVAVLSNMDEAPLRKSLKRIGVFFNVVVSAEKVNAYKPAQDGFLALLREVGAPPEEVLHCAFGARYDLAPAKALGFKTALIRRGPEGKLPIEPDYRFSSLTEMADLFLKQHRP